MLADSITHFWEAPFNSGWRKVQRTTAKHYLEFRESCKRVGEKIVQAREVKDTTRPTELTGLDPWALIEPEPPTRKHAGAGHRTQAPYLFSSNVQFGLHMEPLSSEQVMFQTLCTAIGFPSPSLDCLVGPWWEKMSQACWESWSGTQGHFSLLWGEEKGQQGYGFVSLGLVGKEGRCWDWNVNE